MITKLNIWLTLPAGEILKVGKLAVKGPDDRGALQGQFRYASEYLTTSKAFPIDPLHLPLVATTFNADRPHAGVHGVFEDSLPDDWGRKLMIYRYKLGRNEQRVPHLLRMLGDQGLGALIYTEGEKPFPLSTGVSGRHLAELVLLAEKFEKSPSTVPDDELFKLFQAGSTPGGARPKVLIVEKEEAWLAKFGSIKDHLDVVSLEAAAMELARRAGIETADTRLLTLGSRRCLLVKRFDINVAGGRNHLISMQSLLNLDGYYNAGYRDMAEAIKHVSTTPQKDLRMLYRQMAFNVMAGNTDDHLKNFCMLHDDRGWRLSPAFDLAPNIGFNTEHVLRIGMDNRPPDLKTMLAEAPYFGIKRRQEALEITARVYEVVSDWNSVFADYNVPEKDAETIGSDLRQRLKNISL